MSHDLTGLRILIVEDDFLNSLQLDEGLRRLGCTTVGPFATIDEGRKAAIECELDAAVLDVQIHGQNSLPIARALAARGIPFVFLTGYRADAFLPDDIPAEAVLAKPSPIEAVARALASRLAATKG